VNGTKVTAGQTIYVDTGREYKIPWSPPVETGGSGGGKWWKLANGDLVPEERWRELFDSLKTYKSCDRNDVCKLFMISYQSLHKRYSKIPNRVIKPDSQRNRDSGGELSALVRIEQLQKKLVKNEQEAVEIKAELSSLADDGIAKLRLQLAELESMK